MRAHKYAELFPLMDDDQLQELANDIKTSGLRQKIVTLDDKILDGRNRERACRMAGVPAIYKEYTGKDPLGYVISQNMRRRHLSVKARAEIAAKIANLASGQRSAPDGAPVTQTTAAKKMGVSRRSVQRAAAKSKPKPAPSKKDEPGWSKEALEKDTELADHLLMIESVYGKEDTKAIRNGTVQMGRADILFLGKMPKENMLKIQDLIFTTGWSPKKCVEFINTEPNDETKVRHLKYLCLTTRGKYWTHDFGDGFVCTMKTNRAAKR